MDYLIVAFLTLLTPFTLSMSDIDYTPGFSVKVSNSTESNLFSNKLSATSIKTGTNSDSDIISVSHFGPYGVFFDLSVEYQIYPFLNKKTFLKNLWFAPKFSYEPLRDSALIIMQPVTSSNTSAIPVMFNQHPSFGFNLGYDVYQFKKGGELLSPYFGMQFMRVGYEGESNFDMQELYDSSIQYTLGLAYRMDENWSANVEFANTFIDARGVEGQTQDVTLKVTRWKFGITYYLSNTIAKQKENKDNTYSEILRSIDSNLNNKIKDKKAIDEAERLAIIENEKEVKIKEEELKAEALKAEELKKATDSSNSDIAKQNKTNTKNKDKSKDKTSRLYRK